MIKPGIEEEAKIERSLTRDFMFDKDDCGYSNADEGGRRVSGLDGGVLGSQWRINERSCEGASLVAQWLRIRLPMQGTRVQALVCEDPT